MKINLAIRIIPLIILLLSTTELAFSQTVEKAWVRRPIPGMKLTGAYMVIKNSSDKDINLVGVEGPDADYYEIHSHEKKDGVMKMRQIHKLKVPAKGQVILKPKSFHIMLIQLKKGRLLPGKTTTNLTLIFDSKEKVTTNATISDGPV